ncbi:MAG: AAA family ATPase, partial [Pirellulaceae bacterium]|nr:AAA family ATPase [Pirellulaceae bacterium]
MSVADSKKRDRNDRNDRKDKPMRVEDILDRSPPCDVSAEMGVLGSVLLLPDVANDLTLVLRPDDFYDDANRKLYTHMMAMFDSGVKIDVMLLVNRLKQAGDYELIGGSAYLAKLAHSVANAAHAIYYAEIVRSKATFRKLIEASTSILRDAYDEAFDAKELVSQAEQRVFRIQDERSSQSADSISDLLTKALDRIDARLKGVHTEGGVDTYFTDYDAMSGGFHNGELIILAARPSMGKTAFAMNVAENVALRGNAPVLFVSLEMSGIELADRLLCSVARVNGHRLRNGTISQDDRKRLVEKAMEISNAPLYVDDSPSRTVSEI